ncbi:Sorting nexin, partial [Globisporangium splendens]
MENRNGKWVNVDYTNRVLDENYANAQQQNHQHVDRIANGDAGYGAGGYPDDDDALFYDGNEHGYGYGASHDDDGDRDHGNGVVVGVAHESYGSNLLGARQQLQQQNQQQSEPESSIQITVSEPVKQGDGMNAYISYKISTDTNRPQFTKSSFSVIRRYSDFIWLHGNLYAMYPGVVVPPLPEKLLVGRFSPEFIESRRRALQLFLHRCCSHPELQHSAHLTTFLEASDDALQQFKADPKNSVAKGTRGSIFQWIDDTVNTISTSLGAMNTYSNLEKTPADHEVDEMIAYIDGLEPIMTGLHKHAHGLTKRAREIADGLFEFGVSFTLLGKSEENRSLQEGLNHIGQCSDRLSILAAEHAEREALNFEEPIFDYIRLVGAVKAALHKRNEVRASYSNTVADLDAKSLVLNKLLKHGSSAGEKIQAAESDVMKAQQRVEDAKLEYDIVTERVMREVERFRHEKLADFKRIILDYIQMQIEYSKKVEDEWNSVIPQLAQIQVETTSPSTSTSTTTNSLIQENYISSDGGVANNMDLLSLSNEDHGTPQLSLYQQRLQPPRPVRHLQPGQANPDVSI